MKDLGLVIWGMLLCCIVIWTVEGDQPAAASGPEMKKIPGGQFKMGCSPGDTGCFEDEKPAHAVRLGTFWLDATEVTQAQYQKIMGSNPSQFSACADCPVERVSWENARDYCAKIGKRLPTEAEWEYAARAGTTAARYDETDAIAWYGKNSQAQTHAVGKKKPNAYGLYDMLGNVWEWCADWYGDNYYKDSPPENPTGPATGSYHVLRGGSFDNADWIVRASDRSGTSAPLVHSSFQGFRCAQN